MLDDGNGRGLGIIYLEKMLALDPFPGIVECIHIGGRGKGETLEPHQKTGFVHHQKHGPHTLVFLPEKGSPAIAFIPQRKRAGCRAVDSHLFFDTRADDIVCLTEAAVCGYPYFRYQKKRDSPGSFGCALDAGEYRVNNVFCKIVVACGDKDFVSGDGIGSVRVFFSRCDQCTHVGSGLRFGQHHGTCPFSGVKLL